jgi:hypothetical protein
MKVVKIDEHMMHVSNDIYEQMQDKLDSAFVAAAMLDFKIEITKRSLSHDIDNINCGFLREDGFSVYLNFKVADNGSFLGSNIVLHDLKNLNLVDFDKLYTEQGRQEFYVFDSRCDGYNHIKPLDIFNEVLIQVV